MPPIIINIRGTSGAGKTHLVRSLMAMGVTTPYYADAVGADLFGPTRMRKPLLYQCSTIEGRRYDVLGSYHANSGGADDLMKTETHGTRDAVFALVKERADLGADVIFEGLLISEVHRLVALHTAGYRVLVIHLDVPIETCLEAIRARRAARGVLTPLNTTLTVQKDIEIRRQVGRLGHAGVDVRSVDRVAALNVLREALEC